MVPRWGVVNIHASLLPKYRGAAPIQASVLNQDTKTGLTLMHMDEGLDTGPILFQEEVSILQDETAGQLHDRLAVKAGAFLTASLKKMSEIPVKEKRQDHTMATYAPKIDRELPHIDWRKTAPEISALIRALDPRPGAYSLWQGKKIKLFSSSVSEPPTQGAPGEILVQGEDGLILGTGQGAVRIRELQYPGRKRLPAAAFLRGCALPVGTRFKIEA
jgi:methionyl-tRNA formyltransferase